jgi:hypothetical protein
LVSWAATSWPRWLRAILAGCSPWSHALAQSGPQVRVDPVEGRNLGARMPHLDLQTLNLLAQELEQWIRHD